VEQGGALIVLPQDEGAAPTGTGKDLLGEDDDLCGIMLLPPEHAGVKVAPVRNGVHHRRFEADSRLRPSFTDVMMPGGVNGPELAIARRRCGSPVLFTSGYPDNAIRASRLARSQRATAAQALSQAGTGDKGQGNPRQTVRFCCCWQREFALKLSCVRDPVAQV